MFLFQSMSGRLKSQPKTDIAFFNLYFFLRGKPSLSRDVGFGYRFHVLSKAGL